MDNEIEIEIVSTDDVLRDYSIANNPFCSKYIKFNPPVKFTVDFKKNETPEETIEVSILQIYSIHLEMNNHLLRKLLYVEWK